MKYLTLLNENTNAKRNILFVIFLNENEIYRAWIKMVLLFIKWLYFTILISRLSNPLLCFRFLCPHIRGLKLNLNLFWILGREKKGTLWKHKWKKKSNFLKWKNKNEFSQALKAGYYCFCVGWSRTLTLIQSHRIQKYLTSS